MREIHKEKLLEQDFGITELNTLFMAKYSARWAIYAARSRCHNPDCSDYPRYGGRGIRVCERWKKSVEDFITDMGEPPPGNTLDRKDVNGDYTPENCRWSTRKEQARNRRSNTLISAHGQTLTVVEWSEKTGLAFHVIWSRLQRGWSHEKSISEPKEERKPRITFVYLGKKMSLSEISRRTGISVDRISYRVKTGLTVEQAVSFR